MLFLSLFLICSLILAKECDNRMLNQKVKITYEGMINASYPASIGATKIEIISTN